MADEQWMTEEFNAESGDTTDFVYRPAFESARTNEDGGRLFGVKFRWRR